MTNEALQDYQPSAPVYQLSDEVRETYPLELDFRTIPTETIRTKRDAMRFVTQHFAATFPENEFASRRMDEHERTLLRADYCQLVENLLPERKRQLDEAIEEAKRKKKEAEELYAATLQEINLRAAEVRHGIVVTKLRDTFCIALAGYYLYYAWNEALGVFQLAKATLANDNSLWASDEKNREAMLQCFGAEFPDTPRVAEAIMPEEPTDF